MSDRPRHRRAAAPRRPRWSPWGRRLAARPLRGPRWSRRWADAVRDVGIWLVMDRQPRPGQPGRWRAAVGAVRYEVIGLASVRVTWVLAALCATVAAGDAMVAAWSVGHDSPAGVTPTVAAPLALAARAPGSPLPPAALAAAVAGTLALGRERRRGTLAVTLAAVPSRWLALAAKALAVALFALFALALQFAVALVTLTLTVSQRLGGQWQPTTQHSGALLGALIVTLLAGLCGLAVGGLSRSLVGAFGVLVLMLALAGAPLRLTARWVGLASAWPALRYLPAQAARDVTSIGLADGAAADGRSFGDAWGSCVALAVCTFTLLIACWLSLSRREP